MTMYGRSASSREVTKRGTCGPRSAASTICSISNEMTLDAGSPGPSRGTFMMSGKAASGALTR